MEGLQAGEVQGAGAGPRGGEEGDQSEEELDDDEERHLPGDDGLQPGRGEHPVQVEHQVTCKQQSKVIICNYQQLHLEIRD